MTDSRPAADSTLSLNQARLLDALCDAFEAALKRSDAAPPNLDDFVAQTAPELRTAALLELLPLEIAYRRQRGETLEAAEYAARYPEAALWLPRWLAAARPPSGAADHEATEEDDNDDDRAADRPRGRLLSRGDQFGKYVVGELLGVGGMGEAYRARDPTLGRDVALKILRPRYQRHAEALACIQLEAQALAALRHPHIVTVYELAEAEGLAYLALELAPGETLARRLQRGPLVAAELFAWAGQLASALQAAHAQRIIHRDLKPQNIFLTSSGEVRVLDFGLARLLEPPTALPSTEAAAPLSRGSSGAKSAGMPPSTSPGRIDWRVGTSGYMAPEQVLGQPVDERTDIFALGCVLYEMLYGRPLFRRSTALATDAAILHEPVERPPAPRSRWEGALFPLVARCVAKSPADRFATVAEFATALDAVRRRLDRRRWIRWAERAGLALACGAALWFGLRAFRDAEQRSHERQFHAALASLPALADGADLGQLKWHVRRLHEAAAQLDWPASTVETLLNGAVGGVAEHHYVMGYLHLEARGHDDILRAIERFEQALATDPHFAPAQVGLGEAYYLLSSAYASPAEMMPQVAAHARRALELSPDNAAAHVLLGLYEHRYAWDWPAAEAEFEQALALAPDMALAHHHYGSSLALQGRFGAAHEHLSRAVQLDPESLVLQSDEALVFLLQGYWQEAARRFEEILDESPAFFRARWGLGEALLCGREYAEAAEALAAACALDDCPEAWAEYAFALARRGDAAGMQQAEQIAARLAAAEGERYVPLTAVAIAELGLGRRDAALAALEAAVERKDEWLVWLGVDAVFEDLEDDPRFEALKRRIGLWIPEGSTPPAP